MFSLDYLSLIILDAIINESDKDSFTNRIFFMFIYKLIMHYDTGYT